MCSGITSNELNQHFKTELAVEQVFDNAEVLDYTLSQKSCQAWRNALLSENIDHSRFAQLRPE